MHIAIMGRQPQIGIAELESFFGAEKISIINDQTTAINTDHFEIQRFGGSLKAGLVINDLRDRSFERLSQKIVDYYKSKWQHLDHKVTLGISVYDETISPGSITRIGLNLKRRLSSTSTSLRLIPNKQSALSTATSHHNKLGLSANKVELLIVKDMSQNYLVAESVGSQNITAYAKRDQSRPKRDAFVGMLPPKLAQIMINLAIGNSHSLFPTPHAPIILDPFCGTGVILQEAAIMGHRTVGTDLSEKMVEYSQINLEWLGRFHNIEQPLSLTAADAQKATWNHPIDAVVSETYLGQPFSAPPSPTKLKEVVGNCNHIISNFLSNLSHQIKPGTRLCLAVPAWRDKDDLITDLPLLGQVERLGYQHVALKYVRAEDLLYYRENQVVARQLVILVKA
jgi:tRNA G10  N-methylase Trm11